MLVTFTIESVLTVEILHTLKMGSCMKMNCIVKTVVLKGMESEMTWNDLTNALNTVSDDVSYIEIDDDGYVTLRIGKIDTDSPVPSNILREVLGL